MPVATAFLSVVLLAQATPPVAAPTPAPPPPPPDISGRPPVGAAGRHSPQVYDVTFTCGVFERSGSLEDPRDQPVAISAALMPVITRSTYSAADIQSPRVSTWQASDVSMPAPQRQGGVQGWNERAQLRVQALRDAVPMLRGGASFGTSRAEIATRGMVRWSMTWRVQAWSGRVDDRAAAQAAWPQTWPDECVDALAPQTFVESGDPVFKAFVDHVSQGKLRSVPVWFATKDLVRATIGTIRIDGSDRVRGQESILLGMNMGGAVAALTTGKGSAHDLVAACVAVLRAAGIPARPVIGFMHGGNNRTDPRLESWAEVYLPGSGWAAFDPSRMASSPIPRDVSQRWPWFGTIDDLNRRIALSYDFTLMQCDPSQSPPAVWGVTTIESGGRRFGGHPCPRSHLEFRSSFVRRGDDP